MSVLDEIIVGVREDLAARKERDSLEEIKARASSAPAPVDVLDSFHGQAFGVIAEVKRSSPSKGVLASIDDPASLARKYQAGGASAISVLTEGRRFNGSLADLAAVRDAVHIPILRKEFIVDEYQIYEARAFGADIILLIVAALDDQTLVDFSLLTHSLGMRVLLEVHDEGELTRVLEQHKNRVLPIDLLGVNARNLKTLDIDNEIFGRLAPHVPAEIPLIAESGISTSDEVARLRSWGAHGILVGEALVKDGKPEESIREFINRAKAVEFRRLGL